jgi:membrane fusion protein, multidrug efflux system
MFHRFIQQASVAFLGAALLVGIGGCDKAGGAPPAASARPPAQVTVASTTVRDVPLYLPEIGKTVAVQSVAIVPQVGGKIIATHVEDGASINKDDLLFEIDPRPFQATVAAANAALAQAKADRNLAEIEFRRVQNLRGTSTISQLEYDQRQSAVAVADARVDAARADLETAKLRLEYTRIYSPITGRAGARLVDAGNIVKENDKPLLVIQQLDPIYAEFTVTENDFGTVRKFLATVGLDMGLEPHKGLAVEVDVPANSGPIHQALGDPIPTTQPAKNRGNARVGTLTFLDNTVQEGTGTIKVRATVPNADYYFWPGQFVNVRVILHTSKNAVLVPNPAIQISQKGPFVYVVDAEGKARLRDIVLGQRQGDLTVVREGLQAGEKVILTGQMMVAPDSPVMIVK